MHYYFHSHINDFFLHVIITSQDARASIIILKMAFVATYILVQIKCQGKVLKELVCVVDRFQSFLYAW